MNFIHTPNWAYPHPITTPGVDLLIGLTEKQLIEMTLCIKKFKVTLDITCDFVDIVYDDAFANPSGVIHDNKKLATDHARYLITSTENLGYYYSYDDNANVLFLATKIQVGLATDLMLFYPRLFYAGGYRNPGDIGFSSTWELDEESGIYDVGTLTLFGKTAPIRGSGTNKDGEENHNYTVNLTIEQAESWSD